MKSSTKLEMNSSIRSNDSGPNQTTQKASSRQVSYNTKPINKNTISEEFEDSSLKNEENDRKNTIDNEFNQEGEDSDNDNLITGSESVMTPPSKYKDDSNQFGVRTETPNGDDMPQINVIEDTDGIAPQENFTINKKKTLRLLKKKNSLKKSSPILKTKTAEAASMLKIESTDSWSKKFTIKGKEGKSKKIKKSRSKNR